MRSKTTCDSEWGLIITFSKLTMFVFAIICNNKDWESNQGYKLTQLLFLSFR